MALKAVVADLTQVPEPIQSEYELRNGAYHLKVEGDIPGFVPAQKLAEFRDNNVRLLKALGADTVESALQRAGLFVGLDSDRIAALKDIDPAKYRELLTKAEALEKKGVNKPDDVQAAIDSALDKFRSTVVAPLQEKLTATEKANLAKDQRIADQALRSAIAERFSKVGGKVSATGFIVEEAKKAFRVVDDKIVPVEGRFGSNGDPLTVEEWMVQSTKEFDFAFEPSAGGGAITRPGTGGAGLQVLRLAKDEPIRFPAGTAGEEMRKKIASGSLVVERTGT